MQAVASRGWLLIAGIKACLTGLAARQPTVQLRLAKRYSVANLD